MPLKQGYSQKTIGKNIGYEIKAHPHQSMDQNIAIALETAREAAQKAHKPALVRKLTQKK